MRNLKTALGVLLVLPVVIGCNPNSPEFVLPEGDARNGQALFVSFSCTSCHTVRDLELPQPEFEGPVKIPLGGGVSKLKSYSELVTSIVNPSHKLYERRRAEDVSQDGESLMAVYNDRMTVTELIDIVAFLETRYTKLERPKVKYTVHKY
ncbi:MAG: c-type cytochrome [Woeseia sp.]